MKIPNLTKFESTINARFELLKARFEPFLDQHEPLISFLKELQHSWGADRPTRLSAALAYYGMFSLAPVIFVAFTIADLFVGRLAVQGQFFKQLETTLGPQTTKFLQEVVVNVSQRTATGTWLTSLVGFGALLYAASGLFTSLQDAVNAIWEAVPQPSGGIIATIRKRLLAFGLVIGLGIAVIASAIFNLIASLLNATLGLGSQLTIVNYGSMLVSIMLAFAILYKVLPDVHVAWGDIWLGAALATLLVGIAGWGLGIYFSHSNVGSAFEAASTMAVLLVAMNYIAQIFLFGAIFARVYAFHFGSRSKQRRDEETE
jgi:membrane protein